MELNKVLIIGLMGVVFLISCNKESDFRQEIIKAIEEKNKGNLSKSLRTCNNIIQKDSTQSFAYLIRGQVKALMDSNMSAIDDYNRAIRIDSNNVAAHFYLGNSYANLNSYSQAVDSYSKAMNLKSKDGFITDYYYNEFDAIESQVDIPQAEIEFYRGISLLFLDRLDEAENSFLFTLVSNYELSWSEYYLGVVYINKGDPVLGCNYLKKSLKNGIKDSESLLEEYCIN